MTTNTSNARTSRRVSRLAVASTLPLVVLAACSEDETSRPAAARATITQPEVGDLEVAPDTARVDLKAPRFTHPTKVTNPLFPVSRQASVLFLGKVEGKRFRTEVTLLDHTRVLHWGGQDVEVLVSQYVAFLDDRIEEVAYDQYAQDDSGAVWYFGEDVYNFDDGVIADTEGTWTAGVDGPPAMIMPAHPKVGDAYRTENIPGLVFEEVTVESADQPYAGPFGSKAGALIVTELHMDGTSESKTFAPGYGEFYTAGGGEVEALAMAVPTDRASGPLPAEITRLGETAMTTYDAAQRRDWPAAATALATTQAAAKELNPGDVPRLVGPVLQATLDRLRSAVSARDSRTAAHEAIGVARTALDLRLRYSLEDEVDLGRMDLWLAQLLVDARARDLAGMSADYFAIDYVRDRIRPSLGEDVRRDLDEGLQEIVDAIAESDFGAVAEAATSLRTTLP